MCFQWNIYLEATAKMLLMALEKAFQFSSPSLSLSLSSSGVFNHLVYNLTVRRGNLLQKLLVKSMLRALDVSSTAAPPTNQRRSLSLSLLVSLCSVVRVHM